MAEATDFYESLAESELAQAIDNSLKADYKRWYVKLDDMNTTMGKLREWFPKRAREIDSLLTTLNTVDGEFTYDPLLDGISDIKDTDRQTAARKVIRDKHLYIVRGDETYSADGKRIK